MRKFLFYGLGAFVFLLINLGCSRRTGMSVGERANSEVQALQRMMSGHFSSAAQAARDSLFFDVQLVMMPIWADDTRYAWLYVEQALAAYHDQPYRQRVYRLSEADDGTFESRVYELPEPERYIHAWELADAFEELSPDRLILREGCSVFLRREGDCYTGATQEGACGSTLRGATYATSRVEVCADGIVSWDQGWNAAGEQVWGAETEGYVFERVE